MEEKEKNGKHFVLAHSEIITDKKLSKYTLNANGANQNHQSIQQYNCASWLFACSFNICLCHPLSLGTARCYLRWTQYCSFHVWISSLKLDGLLQLRRPTDWLQCVFLPWSEMFEQPSCVGMHWLGKEMHWLDVEMQWPDVWMHWLDVWMHWLGVEMHWLDVEMHWPDVGMHLPDLNAVS